MRRSHHYAWQLELLLESADEGIYCIDPNGARTIGVNSVEELGH